MVQLLLHHRQQARRRKWRVCQPLLEDARLHQTEILERCADLLDGGRLKILLTKTFPLEDAETAHRLIETGSTTGKMALIVEE